MEINLKINGLTIEEKEILLKKIDLIKDNIYPELNVDYSMLKHSPNWISIKNEIDDYAVAFELFRLLSNLDFPHKHDDYYEIYENVHMNMSLNFTNEWK